MRTAALLTAALLALPAAAEVVAEADFNDGTLGAFEPAQYGEGEFSVEVVAGLGRDGTPCVRVTNLDPKAGAAAKYGMRYDAGRAYTISFWARAEEGTARVSAYLDTGDWRLNYPGGYCAPVEVGAEWQAVAYTNIHQQGRGYLANVRNNSPGSVLIDDIRIVRSDGEFAINRALASNGGEPSADSLYPQYRLQALNDGLQIHVGSDFTRRATATAETEEPHWVQVAFPGPRPISRMVIYWAAEGGTVYCSRRFDVQVHVEGRWTTVTEVEEPEPAPFSAVEFDEVQATAVRILQPGGGGCAQRPNLLWVSEVEAY